MHILAIVMGSTLPHSFALIGRMRGSDIVALPVALVQVAPETEVEGHPALVEVAVVVRLVEVAEVARPVLAVQGEVVVAVEAG